jgi:hypothetical protein
MIIFRPDKTARLSAHPALDKRSVTALIHGVVVFASNESPRSVACKPMDRGNVT